MNQKADYGIDAPNVIRNLILIGILCLAASITLFYLSNRTQMIWIILTGWVFLAGVSLIITAILMILSSKFGKIKERERILDMLNIQLSHLENLY